MDYVAGFLLGLIVAGIAWALWPRRWEGEVVSLHHVAKMADLHEGTLANHERRLKALERGWGDGAR